MYKIEDINVSNFFEKANSSFLSPGKKSLANQFLLVTSAQTAQINTVCNGKAGEHRLAVAIIQRSCQV